MEALSRLAWAASGHQTGCALCLPTVQILSLRLHQRLPLWLRHPTSPLKLLIVIFLHVYSLVFMIGRERQGNGTAAGSECPAPWIWLCKSFVVHWINMFVHRVCEFFNWREREHTLLWWTLSHCLSLVADFWSADEGIPPASERQFSASATFCSPVLEC